MPTFSSCTIKLEGWDEFETAINPKKFGPMLMKQVGIASKVLMEQFKGELKKTINNSSLWKPNSEWTLRDKARKGTGNKPLLDSRKMLNSIGGTLIPGSRTMSGGQVLGGFSVGVLKSKSTLRPTPYTKKRRARVVTDDINIPYILHEGAVLKNPKSGKPMILPPRPFLKTAMTSAEFTSQINYSLRLALKIAFNKYTAKYG